MGIGLATFFAGLGLLSAFNILTLTWLWQLKSKVGRDEIARHRAQKALERTRPVKRDGGEPGDD